MASEVPYSQNLSKEQLGYAGTPAQADSVPPSDTYQSQDMLNSDGAAAESAAPAQKSKKSKLIKIAIGVTVAVLLALALILSLVFTVGKKSSNNKSESASASTGAPQPTATSPDSEPVEPPPDPTTGVTGSVITMENGTTFTYVNEFGGDWVFDPQNPLTGGGKAQSWSPRITEEWRWGEDLIRGVNLGGWLVTEPFICPGLYEAWLDNPAGIDVVDEYTMSQAMGDRLGEAMEEHYRTFITEQDIAEIAGAGLNWLRIPIGFWAIETIGDEPYLEGVSWTYFLKALGWARKYGLRVYLDLHGLPGSQNGWNHSGKSGSINVMHGVMGVANAQRTLTYLRIFAQFISQPQYKDVVLMMGVLNEVRWHIGGDSIESFYSAAYEAIRGVTGVGAGNGPYIAIHNAFQPNRWTGFLSGADRVVLDQHPYLAFQGDTSPTPASSVLKPCSDWAVQTNRSQIDFGVTVGGEFSTAVNDCGLWLNGIGSTQPPRCTTYNNWASWDETWINDLLQVSLATMDALQNYFYWTWKIGDSTVLGTSSCPMWHYKLGRERGWIPRDPRAAAGHCAREIGSPAPFDGNHPATATGGVGAGVGVATRVFPPSSILPSAMGPAAVSLLPTYTPTGTLITLAAPTFTAAPDVDVGNGWYNAADTELAYVPISGCVYPDAYDSDTAPVPLAPICGV